MNKIRRYIRSRVALVKNDDTVFVFLDIVIAVVLGLIGAVLFVILANWATRFFA